jgi:superfamily II DNA or RNA helicase
MSLKDLELKGLYGSDRDDLLNEFYIPVLSQSVSYKRIAGFFSSNALAIAAKGISKFIDNGGKIQLIANVILSEKDQEAIKKALEEKEKQLIEEIETLDDALKKGHIRLLGWMIKNNKLEIKIAVVPLGLEHKKKGILEDKEGNKISFSGSDNETVKGWLENDEEFHVFCSWVEGDARRHLEPDIEAFNRLWNDEANHVYVFPISEAFKKGLIETAPKNDLEFKELSKVMTEKLLKKNDEKIKKIEKKKETEIELFSYQKEAIDKWFKNGCNGIFEMATGTGKTFTALGCLTRLYEENPRLAIVIVCPYQHLITQWLEKEVPKFGFEGISIFGNSNSWFKDLKNKIFYINNDYTKYLLLGTTYDTFSSKKFIDIIKKIKSPIMLIADEVHWSGAPELRKGLIENYVYRIGLSATPKRWLDDEGTELIYEYFGSKDGPVFEFSLKDAIKTENPKTKETYLCPYEYNPFFVEMTDRELLDYEDMTKKIAKEYFKAQDNSKKREFFELLCIQRQNIIKNAKNKYTKFEEILDLLGNTSHCLIYCSPQQIDHVQEILNKRGIVQSRFTGEESNERRKELLAGFAEGKYKMLVAMKCLDEGVDVRPTKTAIFLASSGNPKEFIQRRGRILRRFPKKEKAVIFDIIVVPRLNAELPEDLFEIERKILEKEFRRYGEFAEISLNYAKTLNIALPIKKKYGVTWN